MDKRIRLGKVSLSLCVVLLLSLFSYQNGIAKIGRGTYVKLTLENQPEISGIAILKLIVSDPHRLINANINCFLPEGLKLINDKNYEVTYTQTISEEWGHNVTFYSGSLEGGVQKEFIFRVHIPDGRKYLITAGGGDNFDSIEIDLGNPEPPESKPEAKEKVGIIEGKQYIRIGIKQVNNKGMSELNISEDSLPPLRTELKIRIKDKPHIRMPYNPQEIPLRYLVYTEEAAKEVEVTVELPERLELINEQNYEIKQQKFKLFQGPMHSQECKAFYFKVRSDKKERFKVKAQTRMLAADGREFLTEDYQHIELGRILY